MLKMYLNDDVNMMFDTFEIILVSKRVERQGISLWYHFFSFYKFLFQLARMMRAGQILEFNKYFSTDYLESQWRTVISMKSFQ